MRPFLAFAAGVLFAIGLAISGMTQPTKVLGFLDVAGTWDPSLAFVMMGAIGVHFFAVRIAKKRPSMSWPEKSTIDAPLAVGAAIFGVGWGLGGFCPGPALASAASGNVGAVVFAVAMAAGMLARRS